MNGKVKFFNRNKGFGFVVSDDGKEYFVHLTGLNEGVRLEDNDIVSFDVEEGERGPKAVNVSLAEGGTDASAPEPESAQDDDDEEKPDEE